MREGILLTQSPTRGVYIGDTGVMDMGPGRELVHGYLEAGACTRLLAALSAYRSAQPQGVGEDQMRTIVIEHNLITAMWQHRVFLSSSSR